MSIALVGVGALHDGSRLREDVHSVVVEGGLIASLSGDGDVDRTAHDTVVDVAGATVIPGLIDSHVHTTFGDYTPRQQTIGFLDSYVHGGTTRAISASEVHVPGRPTDIEGVLALAVAAQRCFADYRPGGMAVHAGSIVLEPGLTVEHFARVAALGVRLAKAGFGAFASAQDYIPVVRAAQEAGLIVMCHCGGGSIPGSQAAIDGDVLLRMAPDVAGHVNGGPTSLADEDVELLVREGTMALQIVHAGNLRSAIHVAESALAHGQFNRVMIATDTPTGSGVIPLGMLRAMTELSSLGPLTPEQAIAAATSHVRARYGLPAGVIEPGAAADLVVLDSPVGSLAADAASAMRRGDLPAVACVVTDGVVRVRRSRNTPPPAKPVQVLERRRWA